MPYGLSSAQPEQEQFGPPANLQPEMGPPSSLMGEQGLTGMMQQLISPQQAQPERPQLQDFGQQGSGPIAGTSGLSPEQSTLYGEFLAQQGEQAAVRLKELDRGAKFRRAMLMVQQIFGTVTHQPELTAQAHVMLQEEEKQRAEQANSAILARVGAVAMQHEKMKSDVVAAKMQAASEMNQNKAIERSGQEARRQMMYRGVNDQGQPPNIADLGIAIYHNNYLSDPTLLERFDEQWPIDRVGMAKELSKAKTVGANEGAAGDSKADAARKIALATEPSKIRVAGAGAGAAAQGRLNVETNPDNVTKEATRTKALTEAKNEGSQTKTWTLSETKSAVTSLISGLPSWTSPAERKAALKRWIQANAHVEMDQKSVDYVKAQLAGMPDR